MRLYAGDHLAHAVHHGREIDSDLGGREPYSGGGACVVERLGAADERLAGHTAGPEALAAEAVLLDQGDARPEHPRARGGHEAGGAGADHDEVVRRVRSASIWHRRLARGCDHAGRGSRVPNALRVGRVSRRTISRTRLLAEDFLRGRGEPE